jgi:hypothetical protein
MWRALPSSPIYFLALPSGPDAAVDHGIPRAFLPATKDFGDDLAQVQLSSAVMPQDLPPNNGQRSDASLTVL